MKKLLLAAIMCVSMAFADEEKIIDLGNGYLMFERISIVEFDSAKTDIIEFHKRDVDILIAYLKEHKEYKVKLIGRSDSKGSAAGNMALSKRRANVVKNYLTKGGIPAGDIVVTAIGASNPLADDSTPAGMSINRSVEIQLFKR